MSYTYRIFDSIDDVDLPSWERVRSQSAGSIFLDPRFIAAAEAGMKQSCRFWYILVYGDGGAAACAGLTAMTIDLADLADPRLGWIMRRAPGILSRFRKLKVMMCGLPGSPGDKCLALTPTNAGAQILSLLDEVIRALATRTGMDIIAFKEFGKDDLDWMNPLLQLGYRCIPSLPMHLFRPAFPDFSQYCAALKTRYRQQINRSTRKLKNTDVELAVLTDPRDILRAYTPEVHGLYLQMAAKADLNLEILPIEFFQELTSRLEGEIELVAYSRQSRIIAFGWCLHTGSTYSMLYAGLDYRLNDELDLYFNLMYAGLDRALRKGVSRIEVGQSAGVFKARLGCYSEPLYVFAKGLGPLMSRIIHYGAGLMIAQVPAHPPSDIFKSGIDIDGAGSKPAERRSPVS
ncbi:MAG: GNAT family N-acetyltransferase [Xanthobacteraceae bacterium]